MESRTTNPYGKKGDELTQILTDLKNIEPLLRKNATYEIMTDIPIEKVIKKLLDIVRLES